MGEHDGHVQDRRGDADPHRGSRPRGHFQVQPQDRVRVGALRQRDEIGLRIGHRHDRRAVHGSRPQLRSVRQGQPEIRVAAVFHEIDCVGEHLAFLGDARGERRAIDHLAERIALRERAEREPQIERARRVAIGREDGRVEEQAILRRHFARFQRQQTGRHVHRLHLELVGADDERVALLGLRVERAGAGERERFALRFERPLVGPEQGVGARHRRVQLHQVAVRGSLPIADVLARKLNVEILGRQLDPERRHRRAGHEVIDHAAAVSDALAD